MEYPMKMLKSERHNHQEKIRSARKTLRDHEQVVLLSETFKVLSDPTRLKIVLALAKDELCVFDIAELLDVSESAVSHQLRLLKTLRLVKYRKNGKMVFYSLDDEHIGCRWSVECHQVDAFDAPTHAIRHRKSQDLEAPAIRPILLGFGKDSPQPVPMEGHQGPEVLPSIDNGLPQHEARQVTSLGADERSERRSESHADQSHARDIAALLHLFHGRGDVRQPLPNIALIALPRRITTARIVEAKHMKAGSRETEGQLPEGAMDAQVFLARWVAEHDAARSDRS